MTSTLWVYKQFQNGTGMLVQAARCMREDDLDPVPKCSNQYGPMFDVSESPLPWLAEHGVPVYQAVKGATKKHWDTIFHADFAGLPEEERLFKLRWL